jgi:toxin ParE1/3/4
MYKLVVSELTHKDLDDIIEYIAIELANPIAATNFLNEVEKRYGYLKNNPFMYGRCYDAHLEKESYRKATINNYVLVYKVDEPNRRVIIYRFFYGAQDYVKLI